MYIESMYDRYVIARWSYLFGEPILSDIEFDKLDKEFKSAYPDDEYSKRHWPFDECPEELLKKYNLTSLIGSTTMGYMAESIYSINNRSEYVSLFSYLNKKSRLSFKIDGWNTRVSYFNGNIVKVESRGRSGNNLSMNNISRLFPQTVPYKGRVAITGELSIPNNKWKEFRDYTGNVDQRSSVRTALARNMIEYLEFLAFNIKIENSSEIGDQYTILESLGFKTPKFLWVSNFKELEESMKYMSFISRAYPYLTDGVVIENDEYQYAIRLGAWEEHVMQSYVTGYEHSQGMYGCYLKVLCKPIQIEGKTFSKISVNNIATIVENNLQVGYPIAFNLRSAANVVLDSSSTAELQRKYKGHYDDYRNIINKSIRRGD